MFWNSKRKLALVASALIGGALLLGACGSGNEAESESSGNNTAAATATQPGGIDYKKLTGNVRVDGSSTVFPISEAVAEEFSKVASGVRANVAFSGTGGGFEKFCRNEIDVSNASRPINQKEKDACAAAGKTNLLELQVAIDALTVVVSPSNTWAKCMTPAQLQLAFKDGGAKKWSDIDPTWPSDTIKFYYPGADSGTFDYFKEAIKLRGEASKEPPHRSDGTSSEDDNVLVRGIEGDKNAIGYFGFAYYQNEGKKLKAVEVNNGTECVTPTFDAAVSGKYKPLSRPLFIYADAKVAETNPTLVGFLKFYMDNASKLSAEVGYVSLPEALLTQQQDKVKPYLPR